MKLLSVLLLPNLAMRDGVGILARSLRDGVCILARSLRDGADILARRLRDGAEIPEWCINSNPQSAGKYTYRCNSVQITLIRMDLLIVKVIRTLHMKVSILIIITKIFKGGVYLKKSGVPVK